MRGLKLRSRRRVSAGGRNFSPSGRRPGISVMATGRRCVFFLRGLLLSVCTFVCASISSRGGTPIWGRASAQGALPILPLPLPLPPLSLTQLVGGKFEFYSPRGLFTSSGALLSHLRGSIGLKWRGIARFILRGGVLQKCNDVPLKKTSFAPKGEIKIDISLEAQLF